METDDQISKEEVSEPTEISPDNPTSVTSTPIDKNKRTRSTAFSPDDKEKNQYPRLEQDDSNLEPDEEPETSVPVIKQAPTMRCLWVHYRQAQLQAEWLHPKDPHLWGDHAGATARAQDVRQYHQTDLWSDWPTR